MLAKDKDYYAVLHLDPSADATTVEHAYWRLAWSLQVAARSDPSAYERLEELNEAYSVLGTPARRVEYDQACLSAPPEPETVEEPRVSTLRLLLLVAGVTLALARRLRRLPSVSALAWSRAPVCVRRPRLPRVAARFQRPSRQSQAAIDPADLRASTADTIARWRKGAKAAPPLRLHERSEEARASTDRSEDLSG